MILLVSSDVLIDQGEMMLYGVEAEAQERGPSLLVVPVTVEGEQRWLNIRRGLTRVYRRSLTQSYGPADPVVVEQVDALLRVALDL